LLCLPMVAWTWREIPSHGGRGSTDGGKEVSG
jgi:hypothetical protein